LLGGQRARLIRGHRAQPPISLIFSRNVPGSCASFGSRRRLACLLYSGSTGYFYWILPGNSCWKDEKRGATGRSGPQAGAPGVRRRSSSRDYRSRARSTSTSTSTGPFPTTRAGRTKSVAQPGGQVRTRRRAGRGRARQACGVDRVRGTTDPGRAVRLHLLLLDPPRQLVPEGRKAWRNRAARNGLDDGPAGGGRARHAA
jgi:hypothetical protein